MFTKQRHHKIGLFFLTTLLFFTSFVFLDKSSVYAASTPKISATLSTKELTSESIKIKFKATASAGISVAKYAKGSKSTSYFKTKGTKVTLNSKGYKNITIKKNATYTFYVKDKAGNTKIKKVTISNIDKTAPTLKIISDISSDIATVSVVASEDLSGLKSVSYLLGDYSDIESEQWENSIDITKTLSFQTTLFGTYSFLAEDNVGNRSIKKVSVSNELNAMWISYLEFGSGTEYSGEKYRSYTEAQFKSKIDAMYDDCVSMNMNAVIVQVRPFGDAFYPSQYFPWSGYISGEQGKNPGYDPLAYMVEAAHNRGLQFHAWLNPYRITNTSWQYDSLSADNPAKIWKASNNLDTRRNVLYFGEKYYYNPSKTEVQELITNGVKEIVANYDVDGIHFDDYFYPTLGGNYKKNFDIMEYNDYKNELVDNTEAMSVADWRRNNINTLVKNVYQSIKAIKPDVVFGISPAGNIDNLTNDQKYYVDIERWLSQSGYVDYICPQIYWGFEHTVCPFDKTTQRWISIKTNPNIALYIGIAVYKASATTDTSEWKLSTDLLARQVQYGRSTANVDGYMYFRYYHFKMSRTETEVKNLLDVLK